MGGVAGVIKLASHDQIPRRNCSENLAAIPHDKMFHADRE